MGYAGLIFFLIFLAFQPSPSVSENTNEGLIPVGDDLILKTCKVTKYYDQCVSYLLKYTPRSASADLVKGLAMTMTRIGKINVTDTASYLSSQLSNPKNNQGVMQKALQECKDKYSLANEFLYNSIEDLGWGIYDSAYFEIRSAKDCAIACQKAFKRYKLGYPREIARREGGFRRVCAIALEIIKSINV